MTAKKNKKRQEVEAAIEIIIEEIEMYPCVAVGSNRIQELTGKTEDYMNDYFDKITGQAIDSYRIDRQLSIIIERMYEENLKLSEANLDPWANQQSFTKAFKTRFNVSPMKFIKSYDGEMLYKKINIKELYDKYEDEIAIKKSLIRRYKNNKIEAAKYILSLKPYHIKPLQSLVKDEDGSIEFMIENKYAQIELGKTDEFISYGTISSTYINEEKKLINKYYDLENPIKVDYIEIPSNEVYLMFGDRVLNKHTQYIGIRESLKEKILEGIDLKDIINKDTDPKSLTTLWEVRRDSSMSEHFLMPSDFINIRFKKIEKEILKCLIYQEQGIVKYFSLEELKDFIKYDYDNVIKPEKEIYIPACEDCEYLECESFDFDDCEHVKKLSKEDMEICLAEHKYVVLTMEKLCEVIINLINKGYIYLKN